MNSAFYSCCVMILGIHCNRELLGTSMGRWCCLPLALRLWSSEAQLSCKTQKSKIFLQSIFKGSGKSLQANCATMCVRVRLLGLAQADLSAGPLLWPSPASYTFASSTGETNTCCLSRLYLIQDLQWTTLEHLNGALTLQPSQRWQATYARIVTDHWLSRQEGG